MGDKVYPMQEGPSAPPIGFPDGKPVAIQMPERAIRQEQQQSLISNQRKERNDAGWNGPSQPPDNAAGGQRGRRRPRRRGCCGCCCCCLASFFATVVAILVIVGVAALVMYLVLRPKAPKFSITGASMEEFNLTGSSTGDFILNTDVVFTVEARNPNKKISIYYGDVDVKLLYAGEQIGAGSIPAFSQGHRSTTLLTLPMTGRDVTPGLVVGAALQASLQSDVSSIWLQTRAVSKVQMKVGGWKTRRFKVHVDCSIQLSTPQSSPGGHVSLLSKSCKIKTKVVFFTMTHSF